VDGPIGGIAELAPPTPNASTTPPSGGVASFVGGRVRSASPAPGINARRSRHLIAPLGRSRYFLVVETFYLSCAGLGGTVLVLQTLLSFIGLGDRDAEGVEEGLNLFSIRALSAGVAFFGIGGLVGAWLGMPILVGLPLALVAGGVAVVATAKVTKAILGLEADKTARIEETIGELGSVNLAIPAHESGAGKVHVRLRGRLVELEAITKDDAIPTGASIEVTDTVGETLVVRRRPDRAS